MFVSVVIPARNAVDRLLYTLYSLNLQYTPFEEFEVIIVDNASTDGLEKRFVSFQAHYPLQLYSCKKKCARAKLLNMGMDKAKGDLLIFLGANMIVPREFIGTHKQAHAHGKRLVLAGEADKRIYSVYYPGFSRQQQKECQKWLETYPQVKRPHTLSNIVPLIDEHQIVSGLLSDIAMPAGTRLPRSRKPWSLFHTKHMSIMRSAFSKVGYFQETGSLKDAEAEMANRLEKARYQIRPMSRLTLLKQEYP